MILGIDTDILVTWVMKGAPLHVAIRGLIKREVQEGGNLLGLTPQVLHEFLHISTDPRRFESPLSMPEALRVGRSLQGAKEILWLLPHTGGRTSNAGASAGASVGPQEDPGYRIGRHLGVCRHPPAGNTQPKGL